MDPSDGQTTAESKSTECSFGPDIAEKLSRGQTWIKVQSEPHELSRQRQCYFGWQVNWFTCGASCQTALVALCCWNKQPQSVFTSIYSCYFEVRCMTQYNISYFLRHWMIKAKSFGGRNSSLVVFGLAVHNVAGSILLWGHFPVEGIFPLELTWVQTPFPPKLFRMRV